MSNKFNYSIRSHPASNEVTNSLEYVRRENEAGRQMKYVGWQELCKKIVRTKNTTIDEYASPIAFWKNVNSRKPKHLGTVLQFCALERVLNCRRALESLILLNSFER